MKLKPNNQRGSIDIETAFGLAVLSLFALALIFGAVCMIYSFGRGYSDGARVGTIVKFSRRGIACKTYEGQAVLSNAVVINRGKDDSGKNAAVFEFTIKDEAVARQVDAALASGDRVTIHYVQWLNTSGCWGDTDYEVTKVEPAHAER